MYPKTQWKISFWLYSPVMRPILLMNIDLSITSETANVINY